MKNLLGISLALLVQSALVVAQSPAKAQYAHACTREYSSSVNIRRGPGRNYGIVASVPTNSYVRLLSWVWGADGMRWYRVESSGIVGFARSDYVCWY